MVSVFVVAILNMRMCFSLFTITEKKGGGVVWSFNIVPPTFSMYLVTVLSDTKFIKCKIRKCGRVANLPTVHQRDQMT